MLELLKTVIGVCRKVHQDEDGGKNVREKRRRLREH